MKRLGDFPTGIMIGLAIGSIAITLNMVALIMIAKINERSPESERMSYFLWRTTTFGLRRRYRELYPDGKLFVLFDICLVAMGVVIIAILFDLLPKS